MNRGLLPADYYALPEQQAAGFGPDVLTLQDLHLAGPSGVVTDTLTRTRPRTTHHVETPAEFHRRRKSSIVVRHVSGDRIVAIVEIVSPGNKSGTHALQAFVQKACELLEHRIHLLIIDPFPPGPRDPNGIHAAIWSLIDDVPFVPPTERPIMLVSYACGLTTHAYMETIAVGERLPDMPLFLESDGHVMVPLEATYLAAWDAFPARWRRVVAGGE